MPETKFHLLIPVSKLKITKKQKTKKVLSNITKN